MESTKDVVELRRCKLNVGEIVDLVTSPNCGAISTFVGTTRDNFESKKVVKLEYEAYEPMALKEMRNLCDKVRSRWNIERMAMYHRLGEVPVSEASIIIAISSPHRQDSLQAVQFAIDTLKSSVPIWKKEIYDGDEPQWKENKECEIRKDSKIAASPAEFSVVKSEESPRIQVKNAASVALSNCDVSDPNLVQIQASTEILNRRIQRFIERKREQVNMVNVQEFCCHRAPRDEEESSCARVDAILIRRKDSKSHVKVHRVSNPWGPQTVDPSTFYKTSIDAPSQNSIGYSFALEERLSTTENLIGITKPVPRDIYQRLKNIEDRVLHLESISPEYKDFWVTEGDDDLKTFHKPHRKRTYSIAELDMKLHELENRYAKKSK